ncbi:MAG: hypothetical protein FIB07_02100 [Candidatus Methanoperedens sp.]|nr:hypothetical protein [Candidatus Methanoperedens sp.]
MNNKIIAIALVSLIIGAGAGYVINRMNVNEKISEKQAEINSLSSEIESLQAASAPLEKDAGLWRQLRATYTDKAPPDMPDHLVKMLSDGKILFIHLDGPVDTARNILWIGDGIPGKFIKADQPKGEGYVHFSGIDTKFMPTSPPE